MAPSLLAAAVFSSLRAGAGCGAGPGSSLQGTCRAVLTTPGGELPFLLEINAQGAVIRNGPEVVPFSSVERDGSRVVLRMEGYDSAIHATWEGPGAPMTGEPSKDFANTVIWRSISFGTSEESLITSPRSLASQVMSDKDSSRASEDCLTISMSGCSSGVGSQPTMAAADPSANMALATTVSISPSK